MTLQVGVKILLRNSEGKLLTLKRSGKFAPTAGMWDFPGGRIEDPATTLIDNLEREVREETGLVLTSKPKLVGAQDIFFVQEGKEDKHVIRLTYVGNTEGEPVLDGVEHTEYQWVSFSELSSLSNLDPYFVELVSNQVITEHSWD